MATNITIPEVLKFLAALAHDAETEYEEHKKNKDDEIGDVDLWKMCVFNTVAGADLDATNGDVTTNGIHIIITAITDNRQRLKEIG